MVARSQEVKEGNGVGFQVGPKDILELRNNGRAHYFHWGGWFHRCIYMQKYKIIHFKPATYSINYTSTMLFFKSTKFMKDSERLKNCHSLEKIRCDN